MAVISSDTFLDLVSYVAGENIVIDAGVTLTIRMSTTVNPGIITVNGTLLVDSTVSGGVSPIVVTFQDNTDDIDVNNTGTFTVNGQWHTLGTGDGTDNQTVSMYGTAGENMVGMCRVETGSGTGVYRYCQNMGAESITLVGTGDPLGNFFTQALASSTLTFGDSTNGIVPASGANIQVPDVLFTNSGSYTATETSRSLISTQTDGTLRLDKCLFSDRIYFNAVEAFSAHIDFVGMFGTFQLTECVDVILNNVHVSRDRQVANVGIRIVACKNMIINDCTGSTWTGTIAGIAIINCKDSILTRCIAYQANKTSTVARTFVCQTSFNIRFVDCSVIGGHAYILSATGVFIKDFSFSDTVTGSETVSNVNPAIFVTTGCTNVRIDGMTLVNNGAVCFNDLVNFTTVDDCSLVNVNVDLNNHCPGISDIVSISKVAIGNAVIGTPRTSDIVTTNNAFNNVIISNIDQDSVQVMTFPPDASQVKGVIMDSTPTSAASSVDGFFGHYYTNTLKTEGDLQIQVWPAAEANYLTLSGTATLNKLNGVNLPAINDSCIMTWLWKIFTVTAFRNVAHTFVGTNPGNIDLDYSISTDDKQTWGSWKTLNTTNLTAETVSPTNGFHLRVRATANAADSANRFFRLDIPVTNDGVTYSYPIGTAPLTLTNIPSGATYVVTDTDTDETIAQGVVSTSPQIVDLPYNFELTSTGVTVKRNILVSITSGGETFENSLTYDALGTDITLPTLKTLSVSNLVSGDSVAVYRTTGPGSSTILRNEFTLSAPGSGVNSAADSVIEVKSTGGVRSAATLPLDVPNSGVLRVLDPNDTGLYLRFPYSSVDRDTRRFTLASGTIGDVTGAVNLTEDDNIHVVFIEVSTTSTSESNSVQYVADIPTVVKMRRAGILPFVTTANFTFLGLSISAVRNTDTIRNADVAVNTYTFSKENETIQIDSPSVLSTVQELVNVIRAFEDNLNNLDIEFILSAEGKADLGFASTAITMTLNNGWKILFEDRAGPARTTAIISGGNIVSDDGSNPITSGAFVDVTIAQAVSAALTSEFSSDIQKVRKYMTNRSTISGNQMHVFDDDGLTEIQTYSLDSEESPKSKVPV